MEFLLSQQEYKGINWEDVQNNYDKIWDLSLAVILWEKLITRGSQKEQKLRKL